MFSSVDADNLVGIYGHPEFEILIQGLFPILPPHLSPTSLPVTSICPVVIKVKIPKINQRERKKMFNSKSAAH